MSWIKEFVDELQRIHNSDAWHGSSLCASLAGITAAQAAASPIPSAHTIWELVAHVTAWEDVWRRRAEGTQVNEPEEGDFPQIPAPTDEAWGATLARLDRVHQEFLLQVRSAKQYGRLDRQSAEIEGAGSNSSRAAAGAHWCAIPLWESVMPGFSAREKAREIVSVPTLTLLHSMQ